MRQGTRAPLFDQKLRWGIASVKVQVDLALEKGLDTARCLSGTGIDAGMLEDPDAEIEARQELQVIRNILDGLGDAGRTFALEAGSRYKLTTYGIWGYALLCSPTLRDALDLGMRFIDLSHALGHVWAEYGERETSVFFETSIGDPALRIYAAERTVACTLTLQRELIGMHVPLYRLWFSHPRQAPLALYQATLGIEPDFERAHTVGSLDTRLLDIRLPRSDALSWRMSEAQCRELIQRRRHRQGLAGRVRDLLLRHPADMPDFDSVATQLNIVPLRLRRQLAQEGTSFRALVDETRCLLAEQILLIDNITVQQAAIRLGYENSISFCQSFKRWTGMTPTDYMRQRKPPAEHRP